MSAAEPTAVKPPGQRRFSGLFPNRLLHHRDPRWWQEVLLVGLGYWIYGHIRNLVPEQESIALRHGRGVQHLQDALHLNFELSVNRFVAEHEPIAQVMNYYYATLHFVVTLGCLIWLYRSHPRIYRGARTILFATSLIALAGFYLYPLAPPRLLPQYGYIDTVLKFHTWGSLADPKIAEHSNQYAAIPSLHIGWALWCGVSIYLCASRAWVRALGAIYPVGTLLVIVGTANHFVIDAVAGLAVFGAGCAVQYLFSGRSAFVQAPIYRHLPKPATENKRADEAAQQPPDSQSAARRSARSAGS
ncbi:phosphatase PAP2 family protein [Jatrophihabitans sp.]|uniref:phosphatase PAP2 family protein n=1 Tax=Jatrophihabitans sp. TaxID=1932789 RepID=UPI002CDF3B77|nr:phosphatase PAP2 family protein [Jatrophihabitans sp.]